MAERVQPLLGHLTRLQTRSNPATAGDVTHERLGLARLLEKAIAWNLAIGLVRWARAAVRRAERADTAG